MCPSPDLQPQCPLTPHPVGHVESKSKPLSMKFHFPGHWVQATEEMLGRAQDPKDRVSGTSALESGCSANIGGTQALCPIEWCVGCSG